MGIPTVNIVNKMQQLNANCTPTITGGNYTSGWLFLHLGKALIQQYLSTVFYQLKTQKNHFTHS